MFQDEFSQTLNRVAFLPNPRDFIARPVRAPRVGHGVPVVPVRVHLQHERTFPRDAVRFRKLHSFLHRQRVHAVDFQPGDVITAFVVLGRLCRFLNRCAHPVVVVFAHVNQRQVPQCGDVQGFEQLTLVRGAVAVHRHGDVGLLFVLHSERQAGADGGLRAHDSVAAEKVRVPLVHVHRTSHPLGRAVHPSHELSHHF